MLPHVQLTPKPKRYPSGLPTSGLKFWISASEYSAGSSITNGQDVKSYNNQFRLGGAINATGTTNVVSWQGKTAFDFRSAGNFFRTANNIGISGTNPSTIILVGAPVNASGGGNGSDYHIGVSWGAVGANLTRALATNAAGTLRSVWYNNDQVFTSSAVGINKPSVMIIRDVSATNAIGNVSQSVRTNDTTQSAHSAINTTDSVVTIGQWSFDANQYPFGYIAEALIYDRSLSDTEVDSVMSYFESFYSIKGFSSASPWSSPTEAATAGTASGTYWFKGGSMTSARQLSYTGANYYDSSAFVRVFSAPYRSTATVNELGNNIPFTKILVRRIDGDVRGLVRFNSQQTYNELSGAGSVGDSAINNFGVGAATRVVLGRAGGHGIYNTAQNECSWGSTISGSIGAGYIGTCGSFPNDLYNGYNPSNSGPNYSNTSGTWEHYVSW